MSVAVKMLSFAISNMSDDIRKEIVNFVNRLEEKARRTPNPIDDLVVDLAKVILEID
ncbi:hypothetical protein ES703_32177 [subsurface metagenome]